MFADRKGIRNHSAVGAALAVVILAALLLGATAASAARPAPEILSPSRSRVVAGRTATLRVRGAHLHVSIGSRDLTKRLGKPVGGVRTVKLRRGKDFHLGANRIVLSTGKGRHRRYVARIFLAARAAKLLSLERLPGRLAQVEYKGRSKAKLGRLLVTVNGRRFAQRDLIRGHGRSFLLQLGVGDGLRYGRNRIVVQGLSADGRRVSRLTRTVDVSRATGPLADAGPDRRAAVGSPLFLNDGGSRSVRGRGRLGRAWRIVAAPKGSKAHLRGANTARPRLVADVPGRYQVRLVATEASPLAAHPGAAVASSAAPQGSDVMTVEASIDESQLGVPVETLTAGGISVDGHTYPVEPSSSGKPAWIQALILDRSTLAVVENVTIPTEYGSSLGSQTELEIELALRNLKSGDLLILSGGGRKVNGFEVNTGTKLVMALQDEVNGLGANATALNTTAGIEALKAGEWSAIGVEGTAVGSGYSNFGAGSSGGFGDQLPAGRAGSLQGYLHYSATAADPADSELGGGYVYLAPDHAAIDTEGPTANGTTVSVEIDGQNYEQTVPQGGSGFDLLLLNHRLEPISDKAYVTNNAGGGEDKDGVEAFFQEMRSLATGGIQPSLVVLQSFGTPSGRSSYWVSDTGVINFRWNATTTENSTQLPNEEESWYSQGGSFSLAAAIGRLGGPVAHDQFVQMVTTEPQPIPAGGQGFTLVAPYGEPSAAYSQIGGGSRPGASRIAGDLVLSHESNWEVAAPSESTAFKSELLDVVYQAPTQWPDSGSPGFEAASRWIAKRLSLGPVTVRQAYYVDDDDDWTAKRDELGELEFPGKHHGFGEAEFKALKAQLRKEFPMVAAVQNCFAGWEKVFAKSEGKGQVDLSAVATKVEGEIAAAIASEQAELNGKLITAHALGIAGGLASAATLGPVGGVFGALSNGLSLANDLSTTKGGSLSSLPVKTKASELGVQLSQRYEAIQDSLAQVRQILVSDWGKLEAAGEQVSNSNGGWELNSSTEEVVGQSLSVSASQQAMTALLPLVYGEYMVSPVGSPMNPEMTRTPWTYTCNQSESADHRVQPVGPTYGNPSSYVAAPYELAGNAGIGFTTNRLFRVMAIQGSFPREPEGEIQKKAPIVLRKALGEQLFKSAGGGGYGLDQVSFFALPAFRRWPLYC
jgi:hypothetical protein